MIERKTMIGGAALLVLLGVGFASEKPATVAPQAASPAQSEQKAQIGDTLRLNDSALGCPTSGHVTGFVYFVASNRHGEKNDYALADEWHANNSKTCAHFRRDHESGVIENIAFDSFSSKNAFCIRLQGWPKCLWFPREDLTLTSPKEKL